MKKPITQFLVWSVFLNPPVYAQEAIEIEIDSAPVEIEIQKPVPAEQPEEPTQQTADSEGTGEESTETKEKSTKKRNYGVAIAVGAIYYQQTPWFNQPLSSAKIESFSSAGGTPVYFDADGDAVRSIYIGRYRNKQLISAFTQLRHITEPEAFAIRKNEFDPKRLLHIEGYPFYRQDVVRVGTRAVSFSDLDLSELSFEIELYLWFRYQGDIDIANIEFLNAVEPFKLDDPVEQLQRNNNNYRLYRINERFKADYHRAPYGQHVLSLSFHHQNLTSNNMIFALDMLAMRDRPDMTEAERVQRAHELIGSTGWELKRGFFFQDIVEQHALGHPDYLLGRSHLSEYSRFNIGIYIQRPVFTLRGLISAGYALYFFIASALLFIVIAVFCSLCAV